MVVGIRVFVFRVGRGKKGRKLGIWISWGLGLDEVGCLYRRSS